MSRITSLNGTGADIIIKLADGNPGAMTVNFALSLRAHCRIETRDADAVILRRD